MKPIQVFYFILSILAGLFIISYSFPKKGITITQNFSVQFPTIDEFFEDSVNTGVDISKIIAQNNVSEKKRVKAKYSLIKKENNTKKVILEDSSVVHYKPVNINPKEVSCRIEFPNNNKSVMYKFFKALVEIPANKKVVRILHYGDSQIEQDRISSFLRYKLQKQFGGSGPGLITPLQSYGFKLPVVSYNSDGWKRFPGFCKRDTSVKHNRYGVMASFGKFANDEYDDSTDLETEHYEWLRFEHSPYARSNLKKYARCKMFYGFNQTPVNLKLSVNDKVVSENTLQPGNLLRVKQWNFSNTPSNLMLEFTGKSSPEIYALALDGNYGVVVDNISLRGSSGTIFTNSNTAILRGIYNNLNAKLIILQFGGNTAASQSEDYSYYEYTFYQQLKKIKQLVPEASIIVVGLADMSKKEKDKYVSLKSVKLVRKAMKNAAFKANCAFWDTYKAMGGENSMPSWVFAEPPLAGKDFVHFTAKGSKIIAQMFYKALMLEYNNYLMAETKQ